MSLSTPPRRGRPFRLGYMVPMFPGQTHSFFWSEILAIRSLAADVHTISTRRPRGCLMPHAWAHDAAAETHYLLPPRPEDVMAAALAAPRALAALSGRSRQDLAKAAAMLPFALGLRRVGRALGIDHLHVGSCGSAALVAALARTFGGPPYSLTLHGPVEDYGPLQDLKWRFASFGSAITADVLSDLVVHFGPSLPEHIFVQPMGVDVDLYRRNVPYEPWRAGEPIRLISVGRLNPAKGHDVTLNAVRLLRAAGFDVRLEIAGEDDDGGRGYRAEVEGLVAELGLGSAVTLLGALDRSRVIERLVAGHVFVLASNAEPLGVAYMEAMSCETPTVGTRAGGVPGLISDGIDGLLVPPRDPDALAEAIRLILEIPALARALGTAGRRTVVRRFRSSLGAERILAAAAWSAARAPLVA